MSGQGVWETGCQLSLELGCGGKERICPGVEEFVTDKFPWEGLAVGRDPGVANVLFWVWEDLERT